MTVLPSTVQYSASYLSPQPRTLCCVASRYEFHGETPKASTGNQYPDSSGIIRIDRKMPMQLFENWIVRLSPFFLPFCTPVSHQLVEGSANLLDLTCCRSGWPQRERHLIVGECEGAGPILKLNDGVQELLVPSNSFPHALEFPAKDFFPWFDLHGACQVLRLMIHCTTFSYPDEYFQLTLRIKSDQAFPTVL